MNNGPLFEPAIHVMAIQAQEVVRAHRENGERHALDYRTIALDSWETYQRAILPVAPKLPGQERDAYVTEVARRLSVFDRELLAKA